MAVEPVVYGASERPPRGDYARANADYTCAQNWAAYTAQDHDTYRRLYERQSAQLPGLASEAFIAALPSLGVKDHIPRFEEINERLYRATRWEIVAVPGLIPELPFFTKAHQLGACEMLARLYWYTIEFGLIREPAGLRAYGAGILSSSGELPYSVQSPEPQRLPLQLERTMRTRYKIDTYQQTYFVIDSFEQLFDMTAADFAPIYERLRGLPEFAAQGPLAQAA